MSEKKVFAKFKCSKAQFGCCDGSNNRYALGAAEIRRAGKGTVSVAACDGNALSIAFAKGELRGADSVMCPQELMAGKFTKHGPENTAGFQDGVWTRGNTIAHQPEGRFPKVECVLPDGNDYAGCNAFILKVKPQQLMDVAKAIGAVDEGYGQVLELLIIRDEKEPHLTSRQMIALGLSGFGVVMPYVVDSTPACRAERYKDLLAQYRDQAETDESEVEPREAVAAS